MLRQLEAATSLQSALPRERTERMFTTTLPSSDSFSLQNCKVHWGPNLGIWCGRAQTFPESLTFVSFSKHGRSPRSSAHFILQYC